ncbi:uncharacterized protein LOC134247893 [Saccostrea cucullata]|uniref:uncharacterized protein LOC134247893 n=1 Tax=Saccostrea cuccullata TaxID=36930 RepID=UPI002ED5DF6A
MAMAASPYASTEETTNACRACRLFLGPCTDQLRDVLLHFVPPSRFPQVIKQKISSLPRLTTPQMNLIIPRGSSYSGNYSDMDISLLYILLRNICCIPPHSNGWGNDPDPTDRCLSANIERIRITRNQCVHSSSPMLSNVDFNKVWSTIRAAVMDIDSFLNNRNQYVRGLHFLEKETMDPVRDLYYIEELRKQAKEDASTREIVLDLEEDVSKLRKAIPLKVKEIHEKDISQWEKDDRVFYESHNFRSMLEKVKNQTHVTFVGVPGAGKTVTARHFALMLQQEGYEIVPIKDIRKIEDYCDPNNPQVFVIDDVVGVLGLQNTKLNLLTDYKDRIVKPVMTKSKTLMTCREAVYRESLESSLFFSDENNIVLLHNDVNALTNTDKKCIMKMYNIDVDLLSPACLTSASKMFPYLCKLFSSEKKFQSNGPAFFENPVPCILKELEEMKRQNKIQYVSLVLCMMNNNKLSKEILDEAEKESAIRDFSEIKQSVLKKCKVSSHTDNFNFDVAMSEMEGTYTKLNGTEYSFVYDSMFENVAHHFGSQFPELILKFMSSNYIAKNVKVKESPIQKMDDKKMIENATISTCSENVVSSRESEQGENNAAVSQEKKSGVESLDLFIRVGEKHYPMLAERLYRDIENMDLDYVFKNSVLKEPKVYQAFEDVLKTKSETELTSLFLSEREVVSKIKRRLIPPLEILPKLFMKDREETFENKKREVKYALRIISWVIYYGHNKILQYILKRTENKQTEPVLFRNITETEIPEKYLLIVLGCSSGDLGTVEILLRYINNDTLNMVHRFSLREVCQGGHVRIEKELLVTGAGGTFLVQNKGTTPLITACRGGYESVVKELIKAKADVNLQAESHTPLSLACSGGHAGVVQDLIKAGANVNHPVPLGIYYSRTPLEAAYKNDQSSIKKDLLEAGVDANLESVQTTPLIMACERGDIRVVQQLLDAGANVNLKCESGDYTPLTMACKGGHMSIVEKLLDARADVNLIDENDTPLTAACKGGSLSTVEKLLDAGAGVNIQDSEGRTPLHNLLLFSTETQIPVKLMVNGYGADPTILDKEGLSPISIALIKNESEVIKQLCNTESSDESYRRKLHLFDCLRVIIQREVMLDSKDDVVVKKGGVLDTNMLEYKFRTIIESKSDALKHLLNLGLDANLGIKEYHYDSYEMKPLLFTLIDDGFGQFPKHNQEEELGILDEKVRILVEAGADVNVNYTMYRERLRRKNSIYNGMYISNPDFVGMKTLVDKNGLSLLERTRRLLKRTLSLCREEDDTSFVPWTEQSFGEMKKYVRRYSE